MAAPLRYLDADALARLQTMTLRARAVVDGALTGLHRSPLFGSSVEFAEHKEYAAGDEIRHIDWKAFGKMDKYYVKRFEQETELRGYLYLDCSGSMGYAGAGRRSKLEFASYLAASLAYLLIRQQDQAGLLALGGQTHAFIPPRSRPQHLANILTMLENVKAEGATQLAKGLSQLVESAQKRSLIVVLSDLFDDITQSLARLRQLRAHGHDVVVFHILDADEREFPFDGLTIFESMEDERSMLVDPVALRRAYQRQIRDFLDLWQRGALEANITYFLVETTRPLDQVLTDFLTYQDARR